MRKKGGKEKEKRSLLCWAGGRVFGPPQARARAGARLRPSGGPRARGRRRRCGPTRQRERRGKRRCGQTAWANRPSEGEGPTAGGLDDGLPPVARFSVQGRVVHHGQRLAILKVGSIRPEGVGRGLSTGRWQSSAAGIAAGGLWVRDWGW
jgi:hypothetical protein